MVPTHNEHSFNSQIQYNLAAGGKECGSIVRGESVYLTMLSGHSRHTHSVSVPNISVLLHTHVEAVLKFEVVSHFAHF